MSNKLILTASLLFPLVVLSSAALAGPTISDKRYWPNEAAATTPEAAKPNDAISAFASTAVAPPHRGEMTPSVAQNAWRYYGGPKSR